MKSDSPGMYKNHGYTMVIRISYTMFPSSPVPAPSPYRPRCRIRQQPALGIFEEALHLQGTEATWPGGETIGKPSENPWENHQNYGKTIGK